MAATTGSTALESEPEILSLECPHHTAAPALINGNESN